MLHLWFLKLNLDGWVSRKRSNTVGELRPVEKTLPKFDGSVRQVMLIVQVSTYKYLNAWCESTV
jgi:hypothetical protein